MHMMNMPGSLQRLRTHVLRKGLRPCLQRMPRRNQKRARDNRTVSLQGVVVISSWMFLLLLVRRSYLPVLLLHMVGHLITYSLMELSTARHGHLDLVGLEDILHVSHHLRHQMT